MNKLDYLVCLVGFVLVACVVYVWSVSMIRLGVESSTVVEPVNEFGGHNSGVVDNKGLDCVYNCASVTYYEDGSFVGCYYLMPCND